MPLAIPGIETRLRDARIGKGLPFEHRRLFRQRRDQYDLFLYLENDILLTPESLDAYLRLTERLPEDYITGFVRFEIRDGQRSLIDISNPAWNRFVRVGLHRRDGLLLFAAANVHSGCYALTRKQLERAIRSGGFVTRPHSRPYGRLEQGASDVYTQCGFRAKVLPFDFEPLLVHHMADKYVNLSGVWQDPGPLTPDSFRQMLIRNEFCVTLPVMTKPRLARARRYVYRVKRSIERVVGRAGDLRGKLL